MGYIMASTLFSLALFDKKIHRGFFALLCAVWLLHNFEAPLRALLHG